MALAAQAPSLHLQPQQSGEPASVAVITSAQLHVLADQIRALRQISIQLHCLRNPTAWKRRPLASNTISGATSCSIPLKSSTKKRPRPSSSCGTRKLGAAATEKQAQSRKKKNRMVSDSEDEDEDSDVLETEEDSHNRGTTASLPSRRPQRRRSAAVSLKEADSDLEVDEDGGGAGLAHQGPVRLPSFKPVVFGKPKSGSDVHCDVCGDAETGENNAILLCDGNGCAVAVHQQCYGVATLPEGDWRCDGCEAGLDPAARHCLLCPVAGGALRSVASMGTVVPPKGVSEQGRGLWAHSACALWCPDITLEHPNTVSGVQLDGLSGASADLKCGACQQKGGGLFQCSFGVCWRSFHVLCARNAGNLMVFRESDGFPLGFCALHSKDRFARTRQDLITGGPAAEEAAEPQVEEDAAAPGPNPYELQRLRNIERNRKRLAELQQG
ncbi:probable protein Jade-3 at C-terminar half [Coccomyxa sp. Obi]|nr:probable protein Jade-3 at C-terminar half [Coccomyxa sp. Obi]